MEGGYKEEEYRELGGEGRMKFGGFVFGFVWKELGRKIGGSREFGVEYNYEIGGEF